MSRRRTVVELEAALNRANAYEEAFRALWNGEQPVRFTSGEGETLQFVDVFGVERACGGVVVVNDEAALVDYAEHWAARATHSPDPYVAELGRKVHAHIVEAVRRRVYENAMGRS